MCWAPLQVDAANSEKFRVMLANLGALHVVINFLTNKQEGFLKKLREARDIYSLAGAAQQCQLVTLLRAGGYSKARTPLSRPTPRADAPASSAARSRPDRRRPPDRRALQGLQDRRREERQTAVLKSGVLSGAMVQSLFHEATLVQSCRFADLGEKDLHAA